jgi:hypothetical protein
MEALMNGSSQQACACRRHDEAMSWARLALIARLGALLESVVYRVLSSSTRSVLISRIPADRGRFEAAD